MGYNPLYTLCPVKEGYTSDLNTSVWHQELIDHSPFSLIYMLYGQFLPTLKRFNTKEGSISKKLKQLKTISITTVSYEKDLYIEPFLKILCVRI